MKQAETQVSAACWSTGLFFTVCRKLFICCLLFVTWSCSIHPHCSLSQEICIPHRCSWCRLSTCFHLWPRWVWDFGQGIRRGQQWGVLREGQQCAAGRLLGFSFPADPTGTFLTHLPKLDLWGTWFQIAPTEPRSHHIPSLLPHPVCLHQ